MEQSDRRDIFILISFLLAYITLHFPDLINNPFFTHYLAPPSHCSLPFASRSFQNELPVNGAPQLPKTMATKSLADQFHDHVVRRTLDNWKYWVFVNITGHLVHSFDQTVKAAHAQELDDTTGEWMSTHLSLQNLRKGQYSGMKRIQS